MSKRRPQFQVGAVGLLAILLAFGGCSSSGTKSGSGGGSGATGTGTGGTGAVGTVAGGAGGGGTQEGGGVDAGGLAMGGAPGGASEAGGVAGVVDGAAGGDAGPSGLLAQCSGAADPCFAGSNLVGTWHCPGNANITVVIGGNGSLDIKNGLGQHGQGCITCAGAFEDVSAADSGGSPSTFVDVNGQLTPSTTMAGSATITWQYCNNTTDLAACSETPMASASTDTCSKTGL